jgi:hypothetical protein
MTSGYSTCCYLPINTGTIATESHRVLKVVTV